MKVGVIGLGNMGENIALNLVRAGHEVTVYNRTKSKAEACVNAGAKLAQTPGDAAQGDVFLTMLSNDSAVESLVFGGADGIISRQAKQAIHVSMSTISPALSKRINDQSVEKGLSYLSAPVLGRPDVAQRGELIVMAAGKPELIEKCTPIFQAIGKKLHVVGEDPQQANVAKVAANFLISTMIESLGEAFALVTKAGVDRAKFCEMMAFDFFDSPVVQKYGKLIIDRNFDKGVFTVELQAKDTRLAADSARDLLCPMPFLSVLGDTFLSAMARGKGDLDPCAITDIIAENAGVKF
jgi:3-hydroxyisobutyrate dehydrogenase-like beta-hydroxyacid dehydrogenase